RGELESRFATFCDAARRSGSESGSDVKQLRQQRSAVEMPAGGNHGKRKGTLSTVSTPPWKSRKDGGFPHSHRTDGLRRKEGAESREATKFNRPGDLPKPTRI